MEISGKIIAVLPQASGQGKNGTWRSQDYVLETSTSGEQYPRKVCFNLFNDKIDKYPLAIDDVVSVSFDIESREFNGKWYTNINAWKVDRVESNQGTSAAGLTPDNFATGAVPTAPDFGPVNPIDDLPF